MLSQVHFGHLLGHEPSWSNTVMAVDLLRYLRFRRRVAESLFVSFEHEQPVRRLDFACVEVQVHELAYVSFGPVRVSRPQFRSIHLDVPVSQVVRSAILG